MEKIKKLLFERLKNIKKLKFLTEILLSSLSVLLFFSIIFGIFLFLATNYRIFLQEFGVYVKDDCEIKGNSIVCNYIDIRSKDYHFKLSDIRAVISLKNILATDPPIDLYVKNFDGIYVNDLKAPPSKKIEGLLPAYVFSNYVKFSVSNVDLRIRNIQEGTHLDIHGLSLKNKKNTIFINNPSINIYKNDKIFDISIKEPENTLIVLYPSHLELNNFKFAYRSFNLHVPIAFINEDKSFNLKGILNLTDISFKGVFISKLFSEFNLNYVPEKKLFLQAKTDIKNLYHEKGYIKTKSIESQILVNGKGLSDYRLEGKLNLNKNEILSKKVIDNITADFKGKKEKTLSLEGSLDAAFVKMNFKLKDNLLSINTDEFSLENFREFLPEYTTLKSLNSDIKLSLKTDLDKKVIDGKIDIKKLTFMDFKDFIGELKFSYPLNKDTVSITSNLTSKDSSLSLNGYIGDLSTQPHFNLYFKANKIKLKNIKFLKELDIDGDIDGTGSIEQSIANPKIKIAGIARTFKYQEINLQNLIYSLNYENKNLEILSSSLDKTLDAKVIIDIPNNHSAIDIKANRFNLSNIERYLQRQSDIFRIVTPTLTSGTVLIDVHNQSYKISLNLKDTLIYPLNGKKPLTLSLDGYISEKSKQLNFNAKGESLFVKNQEFKNLNLTGNLIDDSLIYKANFFYKIDKNNVSIYSEGKYDISKELLNANIKASSQIEIKNKSHPVNFVYKINGALENLEGIGTLWIGEKDLNLRLKATSVNKKQWRIVLNTGAFSYKLYDTDFRFESISGAINFDLDDIKNIKSIVKLSGLSINQKSYALLKIDSLQINLDGDRVYIPQTNYSGILKGNIEIVDYSIKDDHLKLLINGIIDRKYLSEFLQFINLDGNLKFQLSYTGKPEYITTGYNVAIYGENLKLRTPYTQNIINFENFNIRAKDSVVFDILGKTRSSFGEATGSLKGTSSMNFENASFHFSSESFPIRYKDQFSGILNSDINIKAVKREIGIDGSAQITGRAKIEPELLRTEKDREEKPDIIKKTKLNLTLSTFSPVFIEGSWGKVYADGSIKITGTLEKPIINGKVNINYGKVILMKNVYNVDFMNIKITNNDMYINGRLSTFVSGTNIFVNVSGPSDNLRYDFFSTPPKSKEEILTLLLLRKAPEQITSTGIFSVLGAVGQVLIPFRTEEEEKGLFGTGVNINIIPSYSPVHGIVFSVYLQKYLTRRIYLGLSRPLSNYQIYNFVGWYEGGFKITEKTSFVIKLYENNSRSGEITFTLPFDF